MKERLEVTFIVSFFSAYGHWYGSGASPDLTESLLFGLSAGIVVLGLLSISSWRRKKMTEMVEEGEVFNRIHKITNNLVFVIEGQEIFRVTPGRRFILAPDLQEQVAARRFAVYVNSMLPNPIPLDVAQRKP